MKNKFLSKLIHHNPSLGLLVLRICVGAIFVYAGVYKLMDMNSTIGFFGMIGLGAAVAWFIALLETIGGVALILGIWTEVFGALFAIEMLVIVLWLNWGKPWDKYMYETLLFAASLALATSGAGKYSLDKKCGLQAE